MYPEEESEPDLAVTKMECAGHVGRAGLGIVDFLATAAQSPIAASCV